MVAGRLRSRLMRFRRALGYGRRALRDRPVLYGAQENLLRMHGPDGGFPHRLRLSRNLRKTLENAETTSIVITALNSKSTFSFFPILTLPPWIVYVFIGFAG